MNVTPKSLVDNENVIHARYRIPISWLLLLLQEHGLVSLYEGCRLCYAHADTCHRTLDVILEAPLEEFEKAPSADWYTIPGYTTPVSRFVNIPELFRCSTKSLAMGVTIADMNRQRNKEDFVITYGSPDTDTE